jgi:leucyl-tRNA synthetase
LRQWYLRITEYADRLLQGLQTVDFSDAMKDMQSNWIGKSTGAEIEFKCLIPQPLLLAEKGSEKPFDKEGSSGHYFQSADVVQWQSLKAFGRENRKNATEAEDILWQSIRSNKLGVKVRRQHTIQGYIVDFALLTEKLIIEIDGDYHSEEEQAKYDNARTAWFNELGLQVLRFTNSEVINSTEVVLDKIKKAIEQGTGRGGVSAPLLREEKGSGDEAEHSKNAPLPSVKIACYTTRPDTIFGVDFLVLAPEHDLVTR